MRPGSPAEQVNELATLASGRDLDDPAWSQTRRIANETTTELVARGLLPRGLLVALDDPPVVVARAISLIQRRLSDA